MTTVISDEIEIVKDKDNKEELIIGIKRKRTILDNFALFFLGFGILMFLLMLFETQIDLFFIAWTAVFIILFGNLALKLYLAFNEKQIIKIGKDSIVIKKERPFLSKEIKIDRKNNSGFKFEKLGILPSLDIGLLVMLKHLASLYDYPIPTINDFIFFEHFDRQQREWIVKYMNKK